MLAGDVQGLWAMLLGRRDTLKIVVAAALGLGARPVLALEREKNGYYMTGSGVRVKHVAFVSANVYSISHYMTELPPRRSKELVMDMDVGKAFSIRLLRDLSLKDVQKSFREALVRNGCNDEAKLEKFLSAFTHDGKKGATASIVYAPSSKATTLSVQGDGTVSVPGVDFMKMTWGMWFGKTDQPELGDALIARIPG